MHVFRSMLIEAPIEAVWSLVRQFDGVARWNPAVAGARMESGTSTEPGSIRHLDIVDGTVFRETLLALSDQEHFYSYDILDGPLPVRNYLSRHRFVPVTASRQTLGIWEGWFDCDREDEAEMEGVVGDGIYIGGMTGLNSVLKETANG